MTNYSRGVNLEYRVKRQLEKYGYFVIRAAGSHGVADLVAISPKGAFTFFISCKLDEYLPPNEKRELIETAQKYGAIAKITKKMGRKWMLIDP